VGPPYTSVNCGSLLANAMRSVGGSFLESVRALRKYTSLSGVVLLLPQVLYAPLKDNYPGRLTETSGKPASTFRQVSSGLAA
ncbi:MAG: hypothetical protein MUQ10_02110, partial [Anaerolineae bacterium]|nr:hypothetical protein [Anaerolineae bacterium]